MQHLHCQLVTGAAKTSRFCGLKNLSQTGFNDPRRQEIDISMWRTGASPHTTPFLADQRLQKWPEAIMDYSKPLVTTTITDALLSWVVWLCISLELGLELFTTGFIYFSLDVLSVKAVLNRGSFNFRYTWILRNQIRGDGLSAKLEPRPWLSYAGSDSSIKHSLPFAGGSCLVDNSLRHNFQKHRFSFFGWQVVGMAPRLRSP